MLKWANFQISAETNSGEMKRALDDVTKTPVASAGQNIATLATLLQSYRISARKLWMTQSCVSIYLLIILSGPPIRTLGDTIGWNSFLWPSFWCCRTHPWFLELCIMKRIFSWSVCSLNFLMFPLFVSFSFLYILQMEYGKSFSIEGRWKK